ncbi:MAG: HIT domain-containing protein [bacterium]
MKNKKQKTVLVFGTFDVIHPGHIHFLKEAKKLGNLVVSVASDESVTSRKINKPLQNTLARAKAVAKLGIANKIITGDKDLNNWSVIKKINPDIIAIGYDQKELEIALKEAKDKFNFKFIIKKITSKNPKQYHSSIIKKSCAFCTIPEIKNREIISDKYAWAFLTNIPITPGHTLISPKRCVSTFEDLTKNEKDSILKLASKLKLVLKKTFGAEGFHNVWNEGEVAGQTVPHFHLHLIPRIKGDIGITKYEPRKFIYRPGNRESTPEKELSDIAKLIIKNL